MGKLRKETVDRIKELIEEGYRDVEIAEKLGLTRQTIAKYRREFDVNFQSLKSSGTIGSHQPQISAKVVKQLYDLQGVLGVESPEKALDIAYRNHCKAGPYMLKYNTVETLADVIVLLEKDMSGYSMEVNKMIKRMSDFEVKVGKLDDVIRQWNEFVESPTEAQMYNLLVEWGVPQTVLVSWDFCRKGGLEGTHPLTFNLLEFMCVFVEEFMRVKSYDFKIVYDSFGNENVKLVLPRQYS